VPHRMAVRGVSKGSLRLEDDVCVEHGAQHTRFRTRSRPVHRSVFLYPTRSLRTQPRMRVHSASCIIGRRIGREGYMSRSHPQCCMRCVHGHLCIQVVIITTIIWWLRVAWGLLAWTRLWTTAAARRPAMSMMWTRQLACTTSSARQPIPYAIKTVRGSAVRFHWGTTHDLLSTV
jgi:hypothetical protein